MKSMPARYLSLVALYFIGMGTVYSAEAEKEGWRPLHDGIPANIKEAQFGDEDQWRVTLGGHVRVRAERWENFGFDPSADDEFLLGRLLLNVDIRYAEAFRIFIEGKSAEMTDRDLSGGRRASDVDTLAVQNAYIDLYVHEHITLRPGRQELVYGRQRLISSLDWANTRRTFDGAKAMWSGESWKADTFWVRPVPVRKYRYNKTDTDTDFYGVYATRPYPQCGLAMDLYALGLEQEIPGEEGAIVHERRYTVGMRVAGRPDEGAFDFDLEGGYQFGDFGAQDIRAYFLASEFGYRFADIAAAPRIHLGFDYASGDRASDDNKRGTFNQLYPLGHAYFGALDVVGRQNITAYSTGLTLDPRETLKLQLTLHHFRRASTDDALYNAGGQVVRAGDLGEKSEIGTELDVRVVCAVTPKTSAICGAGRLWAGDFIKESGLSKDITFLYLSLQQQF